MIPVTVFSRVNKVSRNDPGSVNVKFNPISNKKFEYDNEGDDDDNDDDDDDVNDDDNDDDDDDVIMMLTMM